MYSIEVLNLGSDIPERVMLLNGYVRAQLFSH